MAIRDTLRFTYNGESIYDPLEILSEITSPGEATITITNYGSSTIEDLGFYIKPTDNLGPVDNPAENPPDTDYQDALMWGTRASAVPAQPGGLKAYIPSTATGVWVTRTYGATYKTKIPIGNLDSGDSVVITVEFITPAEVISRRLFLNIVVE